MKDCEFTPIGERIKYFRKQKGMTQQELADKLNISYVGISQYERGLRKPKLETMYRIAIALGIRLEDLIGLKTFETAAEFEQSRSALAAEMSQNPQDYDSLVVHRKEHYLLIQSEEKDQLDRAFSKLNKAGQRIAVERVKELSEIPRYQKDKKEAPD